MQPASQRWMRFTLPLKFLKIVVAAGLMLWLVRSGRLDLGVFHTAPRWGLHLAGLALLLLCLTLDTLRWQLLLQSQGVRLRFAEVLRYSFIGNFFALFLPGSAGGELARAYYIFKDAPDRRVAGVTTVLLNRILDLYGVVLTGMLAFLVLLLRRPTLPAAVLHTGLSALLLTLAGAAAGLLLWARPSRRLLLRMLPSRLQAPLDAAFEAYRQAPRPLLLAAAATLVASVAYVAAFFLAGTLTSPGAPSWAGIFLVVPLVTLANSVPLSPGGIGVGESVSSLLFAAMGFPAGAGLMLIVRVWLTLLRLAGGLAYFFGPGKRTKQ